MKILLLGYSKIARKRMISFFIKKKIILSIASMSHHENIKNIAHQYKCYDTALKNSMADIAYISLPNSIHFKWAYKALSHGYHVIVDKPLCDTTLELKKLINLSRKKKKLLTEATYFNYHLQFTKSFKLIENLDNIKKISANFTIPMPKKNSLLLSKALNGGAIMDMSPYAAAVSRLFCQEKIISFKVLKKKKEGLTTSFKFLINFKNKVYSGTFRFGGKYTNRLSIYTKKNLIILNRVFSPPANENLYFKTKQNKISKKHKLKKDDCFENFFNEVCEKILKKDYYFYEDQIKYDNFFRNTILKKN